jgi:hypothetical protein
MNSTRNIETAIRTLAPAALVVACALATAASAQSVAMPPHPDINTTGFKGDANTLSDAVKSVEAASGGRVVEIRYNNVSGTPGYDIVVERGSKVSFQRFSNAGDGPFVVTGVTQPAWMLDWANRKDVSLVSKAKVSLPVAIRTAEAATLSGPAVAAGIAKSASNPTSLVHAYNIAVLRDGRLRRIAVDSDTGEVIANPGALAAW